MARYARVHKRGYIVNIDRYPLSESAGLEVAVIPHDAPKAQLDALFEGVNGMIRPMHLCVHVYTSTESYSLFSIRNLLYWRRAEPVCQPHILPDRTVPLQSLHCRQCTGRLLHCVGVSGILFHMLVSAVVHLFYRWHNSTCQGFQLLNILTSGNWSILERNAFNSENISFPLYPAEGWKYDALSFIQISLHPDLHPLNLQLFSSCGEPVA